MIKRNLIITLGFFVLFATLSFGVRADSHKINLVVGEWAEGPLTPWVAEFTEATGIEVDIQPFPFRELLATIEVRGNTKAETCIYCKNSGTTNVLFARGY